MDATILQAASAAWAALSAIAVILLGSVAFSGGRARPPGSVAFGAFAILWGVHVLAGQWMGYPSREHAVTAHLMYLAFLLPLPYLLVQFARAFAKDGARGPAWRALSFASIALAICAVGTLILAPRLLYEGPTIFNERVFPSWGPLFTPLAIAPFFVAMGLAFLALDNARRASTTARTSLRHAFLAAGIATFTSFSAANNLAFYAAEAIVLRRLPFTAAYLVLFAALTGLALLLGVRAAREALRAPSPKTRRAALLVGSVTIAALAWGLAEGLIAYFLLPRFTTIGLWRLAGVAMLAYALARWRMPDLPQRSRQVTATAVGVAAAATSGGLAVGALLLVAPTTSVVVLAGVAIPLATVSPSVRLARRALRVDGEPDLGDATLGRRVETYRAALEASLARNSLEDDDAFLDGLRARLGITPDVHQALLCIARESVLPPPHESHPGYERLRLLGEGAHGRAWLARRRADDELVVIKEPSDQSEGSRAALVRQARFAQRVRHPRLVAIRHVVETPRGPFLVMDHMTGGSLADRLDHGPLAPTEAARAILDVLDGLGALHQAGVTHGDIKAANVLLDAKGRAHLADFGLVRARGADVTLTMLGAQGTLSAMAPEQLAGAPASDATDVYATGALLYRLITGGHYVDFGGLDETRARALILDAPPRLPHPRVPPALEPILLRALAKAPASRYGSAAAMREALEEALSSL